jgi:hypothetical protein
VQAFESSAAHYFPERCCFLRPFGADVGQKPTATLDPTVYFLYATKLIHPRRACQANIAFSWSVRPQPRAMPAPSMPQKTAQVTSEVPPAGLLARTAQTRDRVLARIYSATVVARDCATVAATYHATVPATDHATFPATDRVMVAAASHEIVPAASQATVSATFRAATVTERSGPSPQQRDPGPFSRSNQFCPKKRLPSACLSVIMASKAAKRTGGDTPGLCKLHVAVEATARALIYRDHNAVSWRP